MIFCPNCGTEIDREIQFCPNCGTDLDFQESVQTSRQPRQTPPKTKTPIESAHASNNYPQEKVSGTHFVKFLVITVLLLGGIGGGFFLLAPEYNYQGSSSYANVEEPREVEHFSIDIPTANVYYQLNSTPQTSIVEVDYFFDFTYRGFQGDTFEDIYNVIWESESGNTLFKIERSSSFGMITFDQSEIYITLRTDLIYNLDIEIASGNLDMELNEPLQVNNFDLSIASGNTEISTNNVEFLGRLDIEVASGDFLLNSTHTEFNDQITWDVASGNINFLTEFCAFNGDLDFEIASGSTYISFTNNTFSSDINWQYSGASGNLDVEIIQEISPTANIEAEFDIASGNIGIEYRADVGLCGVKFITDVDSGHTNFEDKSGNFTITDNEMVSDNFNSFYHYIFDLETNSGNIDIVGQY